MEANKCVYGVLSDKTLRLAAERLVMRCGIRADLKGFESLADAIILYGTYSCRGFCELYRVIGERRHINPRSVMREIGYAISQAFDLHVRLSALVRAEIRECDIHNSLVIAYLGKLFERPDLAASEKC